MKRLCLKALWTLALPVLCLAAPQEAAAQEFCEQVCTPSTECDRPCITEHDWPRVYTNCGNWGQCCPWVQSSSQTIGRHAEWAFPTLCHRYDNVLVNEHKACDPGQTRTRCAQYRTDTDFGTPPCCAWTHMYCWGQQC